MSLETLFVLSLLVQVALTIGLLFRLGPARVDAVRRGEVKIKDIALGQNAWPDRVTQISNAYNNQFQLPVLLYSVVLLALVTRKVDIALVGCAWAFVLTRLAHAYVYTTSNHVPSRFRAFGVGVFVLSAMWLWLAARIVIEGA